MDLDFGKIVPFKTEAPKGEGIKTQKARRIKIGNVIGR